MLATEEQFVEFKKELDGMEEFKEWAKVRNFYNKGFGDIGVSVMAAFFLDRKLPVTGDSLDSALNELLARRCLIEGAA